MAIPGIQEIQALATKYSKPQLQKMAQMGLVDPTKAVMAGMMIDLQDTATDAEIVDDEFSVTFEGSLSCSGGALALNYTNSGYVDVALDHPSLPNACIRMGLNLILNLETGRIMLRASADLPDSYFPSVSLECDDDPSGDVISFLPMNFDQVTCGNAQLDGTGTIELWDEQSDASMGFADVTITQN
jgi:hypothetical protein